MPKIAGIALDSWKLPIFKLHLDQAGYTYEQKGEGSLLVLQVAYEDQQIEHLTKTVKAANEEAAKSKGPKS